METACRFGLGGLASGRSRRTLLSLTKVFRDRGYDSWKLADPYILSPPERTFPKSTGYAMILPTRGIFGRGQPGTAEELLLQFNYMVGMQFIHYSPGHSISYDINVELDRIHSSAHFAHGMVAMSLSALSKFGMKIRCISTFSRRLLHLQMHCSVRTIHCQ